MWFKIRSISNSIKSSRYTSSFILIGLFLSTLIMPAIEYQFIFKQDAFVQFDLKGTTQDFANGLAHQKIDAQTMQKLVTRFTVLLQNDLNSYASSHHKKIVVSAAVIAGVPDITDVIKAELVDQLSQDKREKK